MKHYQSAYYVNCSPVIPVSGKITATYHVLPSTLCLQCAIRGLQHMKLRCCEIDARHVRMICKLRKEGVSCQKISDRLDISRHFVRLVMQEVN
ncbi:MAG: hypothetical protein V3U62_06575 [Sedimenticolaceae bacterium]